jgi:hypothetical protein
LISIFGIEKIDHLSIASNQYTDKEMYQSLDKESSFDHITKSFSNMNIGNCDTNIGNCDTNIGNCDINITGQDFLGTIIRLQSIELQSLMVQDHLPDISNRDISIIKDCDQTINNIFHKYNIIYNFKDYNLSNQELLLTIIRLQSIEIQNIKIQNRILKKTTRLGKLQFTLPNS